MTLQIYDSATRTQRAFTPINQGRVGIYICGLTTQGQPHIGHVRFAIAFDILRNWLEIGHGYEVTLVRNVTDIDDKILVKGTENQVPWNEWSYAHERATSDALEVLGVRRPSYEPRATGHITDMVDLMEILVEKGHAYPAPDGSGDVYFDVQSFPEYGALTGQKVSEMESAADADPRAKRDPHDFALWKGRKSGEPDSASWPTPFGLGRPGWHLECSAMARRWLGDSFDIHGGGIDLRFPHHENEQAQSRAAGLGFAQYWMHNGWVTMGGEKMSKSLGNTLTVAELSQKWSPLVLRYYLGAVHYRSAIEYHPGALEEAEAAVNRITAFLRRVWPQVPKEAAAGLISYAPGQGVLRENIDLHHLPAAFCAAMDDDVNVSGALAVVFDTVRHGNTALDNHDAVAAEEAAVAVVAMTEVLGVNPLNTRWQEHSAQNQEYDALSTLVETLLSHRQQARAARDYATADAVRDQLSAAGIIIDDTPEGARWSVRS